MTIQQAAPRRTLAIRSIAIAAAFLCAPGALAQPIIPKHRAAPPADFLDEGPLAPPNPALHALSTNTAAIPVRLEPGPDGALTWSRRLPIDASHRVRLMALGQDGEPWSIAVSTPGAPMRRLADNAIDDDITSTTGPVRLGALRTTGTSYEIADRAPGDWTIRLDAPRNASSRGVLLIDTGGQRRLATHLTTLDLIAGEPIGVAAMLHDAPLEPGAAPRALLEAVTSAKVTLQERSADNPITLTMRDDGRSADGAPRDGRFGAFLPIDRPGQYTLHIEVEGRGPDGEALIRTSQRAFPVIERALSIAGPARAAPLADGRLNIALPVETNADPSHVKLVAEVWGASPEGEPIPVCWIGAMSAVDADGELITTLDPRWIARAGAQAPYSLRNLRIIDPDTNIAIDRRAELPLILDQRALEDVAFEGEITADMLLAPPRPDSALPLEFASRESARAFGAHNLMLVHGYCSGGVWPPGDFGGFTEFFLDADQNRTHDEFALLIASFGFDSKSFGVVAHSQGGAAALQLFANYFSGLDFAEGPRLIQSVGTPYQGTPLGGNLAALGEIFGSGCGTNFDLSVEGAALWLATIPSAARQRVHYYTTSFLDDFGFDYCNLVSDFFLSDPDDGVVEMFRGQLPGGVNRGHVEGWCHTTGMRDPAQYTDQSRNAEMNANAAR